MSMTTIAFLLILVAAASTSPAPGARVRMRRDVAAGSKSGAGSGAVSFSSSGTGTGAGVYYSSGPVPGIGARSGYDGGQGYNAVNPNPSGFVFPDYGAQAYAGQNQYPVDFNALFQQYVAFMQRMAMQQAALQNEISSRGAFGGFGQPDYSGGFVFPEAGNFNPGAGNFNPGANSYNPGTNSYNPDSSASASASLSPRGGFGSASIGPPLQTRMGSVPASGNGGEFSVFSSSSSSSSDINGVKKNAKEATSVINDNGKVTTYHISDP